MLPISICIFISFSTKTFFAYSVVRYFKKLEFDSFNCLPILYSAYALSLLASTPSPPAKTSIVQATFLNSLSNVFECCAISAVSSSSSFSKTSYTSGNARFKFLDSATLFLSLVFNCSCSCLCCCWPINTEHYSLSNCLRSVVIIVIVIIAVRRWRAEKYMRKVVRWRWWKWRFCRQSSIITVVVIIIIVAI